MRAPLATGRYMMQAGSRIKDHVTGGQFDALRAVSIFDHQFAAFVFIGIGEEQSGGDIRADALAATGHLADGVIDVSAEGLAAGVTIEQGRKDLQRECGRNEQGILAKRAEHQLSEFTRGRGAFGQLDIVLGTGGLMAGGHAAIHPIRGIQDLARVAHLLLS